MIVVFARNICHNPFIIKVKIEASFNNAQKDNYLISSISAIKLI